MLPACRASFSTVQKRCPVKAPCDGMPWFVPC